MMLSRRDFVRSSLAAGAALTAPAILGADKVNANYRTALIGAGWWGTNILREAIRSGACRAVALCDVDEAQVQSCLSEVKTFSSDEPNIYKDYRELLDREKPDICIVATPDHWHPLATIDACRAGAHVYVEKPISHTILEGRAMVQAARETDRVVQVGTHRRVSPHNISAMEFLKSGKAGKIGMVRAFVGYGGGPEEPQENEEPPAGLDWDLWCGPSPLRPFNRKIHPKGFRSFLDYANGTIGDWGIHWFDQINWWAGDDQTPRTVYSTGGRPIAGPPVNDGQRQTTDAPDHQIAAFDFDNFSVSWENRRFGGNNAEKAGSQAVGCYYYGTEGTFYQGWRDGWTFYPVNTKKATIHVEPQLNEPDQQNIRELWADFLKAIRTGERPVSDIEIGHRSTTLSLLGMLSMRLGRSVDWDGENEICVRQVDGQPVPDDEANRLLRREYRSPWEYPVPERT